MNEATKGCAGEFCLSMADMRGCTCQQVLFQSQKTKQKLWLHRALGALRALPRRSSYFVFDPGEREVRLSSLRLLVGGLNFEKSSAFLTDHEDDKLV